jgi:flavin-dependent dehydrogenase
MYDAIVVGARCAGAATAMLLARNGHRVLLVDRGHFPSDMRLSTHLVWQPGIARLDRWGLREQLAGSGCPAITGGAIDFGAFTLTGSIPPAGDVREAYAPRRFVLDTLLVEAAARAEAERSWRAARSTGWSPGTRLTARDRGCTASAAGSAAGGSPPPRAS